MYKFSSYCKTTEQMMKSWYIHSKSVLEQSSDLGTVREHFIQTVLSNFLPKTVIIGKGEIIDGTEQGRSGQQDIILYRADFPILTSHTYINTYFIEGVIATIEIKSNLSKVGLETPFSNAATVMRLHKEAMKLGHSTEENYIKLQMIHSAKSFVVGYQGWKSPKSLVKNYRIAREKLGKYLPDVVYYPGICVIFDPVQNIVGFTQESPFSVFFQKLLQSVMRIVSTTVKYPGINAEMWYTFDKYFSLDLIKLENIDDSKFD